MPFHSKRLTRSQRSFFFFFLKIVILKKKIDSFCSFQFFDHVIQKKLNQPNKSLRKPESQHYINFAQNLISFTSFQTSSCVPYAFDKNGQKKKFFFLHFKMYHFHVACCLCSIIFFSCFVLAAFLYVCVFVFFFQIFFDLVRQINKKAPAKKPKRTRRGPRCRIL